MQFIATNYNNMPLYIQFTDIQPIFSFQTRYADNVFKALKASIKRRGLNSPIIIGEGFGLHQLYSQDYSRGYECFDGYQRLRAVNELIQEQQYYFDTIPIVLVKNNQPLKDALATTGLSLDTQKYIIDAYYWDQHHLKPIQKNVFVAKWLAPEIIKLARENQYNHYNNITSVASIISQHAISSRIHSKNAIRPDLMRIKHFLDIAPEFYELIFYNEFRLSVRYMMQLNKLYKTQPDNVIRLLNKLIQLKDTAPRKNLSLLVPALIKEFIIAPDMNSTSNIEQTYENIMSSATTTLLQAMFSKLLLSPISIQEQALHRLKDLQVN